MTGAALSRATLRDASVLNAASLQLLLAEEGLTITLRDDVEHILAQWPMVTMYPAAGTHQRKAVVFRKTERGEWRGALLVSFTPKAWDLVHSVPRFRDVLDVRMWLRAHSPTRSTRPVRLH